MNCDFCKEPLESGRHPRTESGAYDVTGCQVVFLLRRNGELESLLRAFSANFDVDPEKWCKPGQTGLWVAEEADVRHWQKLVAQAVGEAPTGNASQLGDK